MKKIALIGSTGSIGRQAVSVALKHPELFKISLLCAHSNAEQFMYQVNAVKPEYAALSCKQSAKSVSVPKQTRFFAGEDEILRLINEVDCDVVFVAVSGFAGLKYSLAAINAKKQLALANKESLVCGGDLVIPLAKEQGVSVIPVDSEHSAIWQCLNFNSRKSFKNLIITASGGAFRDYSPDQLKTVTAKQALNHPTWQMGKKITVDCATLLNKGYEVIEAHHLYAADYKNIKTVIHRESIVHSMVEFNDGAIMAQMGVPSMILPIQLALTYPERYPCDTQSLSFESAFSLNFQPLVRKNYPCYDLALSCAEAGGIMPCALNAAAEEAVNAFLKDEIGFLNIAEVIDGVLQKTENLKVTDYSVLQAVDAEARDRAQIIIKR